MLVSKEVEVGVSGHIKYFESLGYEIPKYYNKHNRKLLIKNGTKIKVKVEDLPPGSTAYVEVMCDLCKKITSKQYRYYLKQINKFGMNSCKECNEKNLSNKIFKKYGVHSPQELDWVKDKTKNNNLNNLGFEYPMQSPKVKETMKKNNLDKFGYEYASQSPEIKKKMSGENSGAWKGGITPENQRIRHSEEFKQWRVAVFTRDNFTCQCCGDSKGHNLQAHHKYNFAEYPDLRFDVDNGITLCNKCHDFKIVGSFHHTYGTHNNTPKQLIEYIQYIQNKYNNSLIDNREVI